MKEDEKIQQQLTEMRKKLTAAEERRSQLLMENAELSRDLREAEALQAVGQGNGAGALRVRLENSKLELGELEQKIESLWSAISMLQKRYKESRRFEQTAEDAKVTQQLTDA